MSDMNRVVLTGRASRIPELKNTNGKEWCFLSIAINEYDFKTKGQKTTFVSVMVGGKLAAIVCDKVDKGSVVVVEGCITVRQGDREKGTKDQLGIRAENVIFTAAPKRAEPESEPEEDPY